ncbi:MAG: TetR/AcrR family transcriptional regulator [Asticcacaulis sp.]
MRYDVDHKEKTRLRLLTDAAIMLREDGPDGLSVATLMKRQGLTHGGFYAHFASKDDLIACAIDVMFERNAERFRLRTRGLSPLQGILALHRLLPVAQPLQQAGPGLSDPNRRRRRGAHGS